MNAKWLHSELSVLMIGLLLCLSNPIAAQERDTVIVVRRDTVWLPRPTADTIMESQVKESR